MYRIFCVPMGCNITEVRDGKLVFAGRGASFHTALEALHWLEDHEQEMKNSGFALSDFEIQRWEVTKTYPCDNE